MLPDVGAVELDSRGPTVSARVQIGEPPASAGIDLLALLRAAARGEIVSVPAPLRQLCRAVDATTGTVLLQVAAVLRNLSPQNMGMEGDERHDHR